MIQISLLISLQLNHITLRVGKKKDYPFMRHTNKSSEMQASTCQSTTPFTIHDRIYFKNKKKKVENLKWVMWSNTEKSTLHPLRFAALWAVQTAQLRLVSHSAGGQNQPGKTGRSSGPMGALGAVQISQQHSFPLDKAHAGWPSLSPVTPLLPKISFTELGVN